MGERITSPTLRKIAENSLINGEVKLVLDDVNGNFHYLLSEQRNWEKGRIPDLRKQILTLDASRFFEKRGDEIYDVGNTSDIQEFVRNTLTEESRFKDVA